MSTPPPSAAPANGAERALSLLIADGDAAAQLAAQAADDTTAPAATRALALAVMALHGFRTGTVAAGLAALARADAFLLQHGANARAQDLLIHARALWHRREGRPAESQALLAPLHERADQRPATDAYYAASAMGVAVSMRGDEVAALDLYYQALALARRSGEGSLLVNALNNLGSHQSDLYNLEDGEPLLQECLQRAVELGSRRQVIYAAGNLAQCLCFMGRPQEALAVVEQHLLGHIRPEDPPALQRDEEIAQALLDNGRVDEAEAVLGGEAHVDPMSNEMATGRVWLRARVLLARGRPKEALALCLQRQSQLHDSGEASTVAVDQLNLLRVSAQAAAEVGDHPQAYRLLHDALATYEQLLGRAARSRHLSLQITHRLRQAESERDSAQHMAARLGVLNTTLQAQVAENERLQRQLRAQALEDPLTGLHNRRHLMDAGAALLSLLRRRGGPLALVLIDLDHFKQVNDIHGHEAGDQVLMAFAGLARRDTRTEDLACRYGGEEFVLLLPGANAAQAVARMGELLNSFCRLRFAGAAGAEFSCSFSAGVAVVTPSEGDAGAETLPALLAQADAALYAAKQAGRRRVELALGTRT